MTDDLTLPDFLRIPAADRAAGWAENPPKPMPQDAFVPRKYELPPEVVEQRKQKSRGQIAKMKARIQFKQDLSQIPPGCPKRWDPRRSRFVPDIFIPGVKDVSKLTREQIEAHMRNDPLVKQYAEKVKPQHVGGEPNKFKITTSSRQPSKTQAAVKDDIAARVAELVTVAGHFNHERLKSFAKSNGVWDDKYATLNNGLQRMNVVNRLRGRLKKDPKFEVKWPS